MNKVEYANECFNNGFNVHNRCFPLFAKNLVWKKKPGVKIACSLGAE
jgi:hypothetical protein